MPSIQQNESPRENNFTFLRLLAAWMVLFSHAFGILNKGELQPAIKIFGGSILFSHLGLFFFFTVSGFLVSKSYHQSSSASHFLLKRFLRIFPGLAGVNIFCIILGGFISVIGLYAYYTNFSTWSYLIVNSSLLRIQYALPGVFEKLHDNTINASLWTILLEVKFYILMLLAGLTGILSNKKILITGFIFFCVLYFLYNNHFIPRVHFVDLPIYFWLGVYFYAGVILYQIMNLVKYRWIVFSILLILALLFSKTTLYPITTCFFLSYTFLWIAIGRFIFQII